jgi:hypothetical protein
MCEMIRNWVVAERIGKYLSVERSVRQPKGGKTVRWDVVSNRGQCLGFIGWYGAWRQYVFEPEPATVFNRECLLDIATYLERVNEEHKRKQRGTAYDRRVRGGEIEP